MIRVTNISKRSVTVGGVIIKSLHSYTFPDNLPDSVQEDINNLSNLGFIRVTIIDASTDMSGVNNETSTRKSNKKNK